MKSSGTTANKGNLLIRNSIAEFLIFTRQAGEDGIEVRYRAIQACYNAKIAPADHFAHVGKMVTVGSGARRMEKK